MLCCATNTGVRLTDKHILTLLFLFSLPIKAFFLIIQFFLFYIFLFSISLQSPSYILQTVTYNQLKKKIK